MEKENFFEQLEKNSRPVVIDVWAPWCMPCRAMAPALEKVSQKFDGQVDVWKVNADEQPQVANALGIMAIPTMIGFSNGKEVTRFTGAQSEGMLAGFFESTINGTPVKRGPTPVDRIVRLVGGTGVAILGWSTFHSLIPILLGAVLAFTAVYDRCPIYNAIKPRIVALFKGKGLSG